MYANTQLYGYEAIGISALILPKDMTQNEREESLRKLCYKRKEHEREDNEIHPLWACCGFSSCNISLGDKPVLVIKAGEDCARRNLLLYASILLDIWKWRYTRKHGMEILCFDEKVIELTATVENQLRGEMRSIIRGKSGNAALGIKIECVASTKNSLAYHPIELRARACAGLLVPKSMSEEEKAEFRAKFESKKSES